MENEMDLHFSKGQFPDTVKCAEKKEKNWLYPAKNRA